MSAAVIRREDPASLAAALVAAGLLAAATLAAAYTGWRRVRALVRRPGDGRCLPGTGQVVVIPEGAADAYTVPGWPGRIVVTAGMLDALDTVERQVLLAHEGAHADNHHYLFTALSHFAAAANPLLRPVAAAVSYTVERWADEAAAGHCGDRQAGGPGCGQGRAGFVPDGVAPCRPGGADRHRRIGAGPGAAPGRPGLTGRSTAPGGGLAHAQRPSVRPLLIAAATAVVLVVRGRGAGRRLRPARAGRARPNPGAPDSLLTVWPGCGVRLS